MFGSLSTPQNNYIQIIEQMNKHPTIKTLCFRNSSGLVSSILNEEHV